MINTQKFNVVRRFKNIKWAEVDKTMLAFNIAMTGIMFYFMHAIRVGVSYEEFEQRHEIRNGCEVNK